ncbi:MAG: radical SAM protein [Candidatus Izemoplasmatales bacterium]|jgi:DNA repair photolyase|nr:hypothetical protein [Candidatus Izemoplasmatales bacterium]MDD3865761.1 hypothetical protein [Candidatus Izemoplasmatales bacterium]
MRKILAKSLFLPPYNNYNIYRGCTHGCIYCDSRSKCYEIELPFENITVKTNAVELARCELSKKRNPIMVNSGSMCDPYMPIEAQLELSRNVLKVVLEYGHGAGFLTKNILALRDLDLMVKINIKAKAIACFTLTTVDDHLAKIIEPNASLPSERLKALRQFADAGITTGVWMTPLLPFITANVDNVKAIVAACAMALVKYIHIFEIGTSMREGSRDFFYNNLDRLFPGMKERYQQTYGLKYICLAPEHEKLEKVFRDECDKYGIVYLKEDIANLRQIPKHSQQLSLF